jgi:hypothetical protein
VEKHFLENFGPAFVYVTVAPVLGNFDPAIEQLTAGGGIPT